MTERNISRLKQFGTAWSRNRVLSACCRPLSRLTPLAVTWAPSPAKARYPSSGHVERVEARFRADRKDRVGNIDGIRRVSHQPHVLQIGVLAEVDSDSVIGLIGPRAFGCDEALQQGRSCTLADGQERAGIVRCRRTCRDMHDVKGFRERGTFGNRDQHAISRQCCVQRKHRACDCATAEQICSRIVSRLLERVAQGPHAHTPLLGRKIRKLRREHAIDQDQPPSFGYGKRCQRCLGALERGGIGSFSKRKHLAHQCAQISVFPFFDPPVRQTRALVVLERSLAHLRDRALARQPVARGREDIACRACGVGFCQCKIHHQIRLNSVAKARRSRFGLLIYA
jgi:hypothetical protein